MPSITALSDATLFTGEAFVEGHALILAEGKVLDIVSNRKIPAGAKTVSRAGMILAPGFIDLQVNGGGDLMFNNDPTADTCVAIASAHRKFGTAHILPTVISDSLEVRQKAVAAVREARRKDKSILGIHIEGPHLGEARRGVHKAEHLHAISADDMKLYRREGDEVMLITLAPECVPPEPIKQLRAQGAIVSIGHTQATAAATRAALAAGATGFTHLFNGMNKSVEPESGPAAVALADQNSWCGLIADDYHVSADMIRYALKAKPGGIFLVSDAMPPSASDNPKPFQLYGETITPDKGRCVNHEGKLAGAVLTLGEAVRNCIKKFSVEPDEALRMTSLYQARFLGMDKSLGKLLPGFEGDVVALDTEFTVLPMPRL